MRLPIDAPTHTTAGLGERLLRCWAVIRNGKPSFRFQRDAPPTKNGVKFERSFLLMDARRSFKQRLVVYTEHNPLIRNIFRISVTHYCFKFFKAMLLFSCRVKHPRSRATGNSTHRD